ncbi:hepatitis A virus cellular receptor 1 homolog [Dermochelys coriacea]|uniref:hepatitis A virus cellular receptor 1 homolog n=1 Tax=Dermochelys coriacea TaxID=27794 RepID=UPI001CA8EB51|nr:hepatitis A virus cellular receptor 1 homolog [Dermochelys coriacea]
MAPCFILKRILMVLFTGLTVSGSPVRGVVGQNVILLCKYQVNRQSDITTMCWGRGSCPSSQCSQPILWTDGWRVTKRQSSRYQLEGNLAQGDVSLTIVDVAEADGGVYCCRVEIPGWFNDQWNNLEVVIETVAANATQVSSSVTPRWLSISSSEAPQAFTVSTSVHPLEPGSRGTGMYIRIGVILSLLVLLILSLLIFTLCCGRRAVITMAPYFILEWILMVLFTGLTVSGSPVRGVVGQNVILLCKYQVNRQSDITTMCWGRGSCPSSQCSQPILWTDGWRVTKRQSSRYQLEGNLAQGDVSLTIVDVAEADGGVYCCRVEIPGWFNDQWNNLEVVIETARISSAGPHTYTSEHTSAAVNASDTSSTIAPQWPLVFSSEAPQDTSIQTMSTLIHQLMEPESRGAGMHVGISIFVVLLVTLVLALILSKRYFHNRQKPKTLASSVSFSNPEHGGFQSTLEAGVHAEENIYMMD